MKFALVTIKAPRSRWEQQEGQEDPHRVTTITLEATNMRHEDEEHLARLALTHKVINTELLPIQGEMKLK